MQYMKKVIQVKKSRDLHGTPTQTYGRHLPVTVTVSLADNIHR